MSKSKRPNREPTPPSRIDDVDRDDFFADPDMMFDELPQPFRTIDKILEGIFDDSWNIINKRQAEREAGTLKVPVPIYNGVRVGTTTEEPRCLAPSVDGNYVFLGHADGLVVLKPPSVLTLTSWDENGVLPVQLSTADMPGSIYLVTMLSNLGVGRVFALFKNRLFLLRIINDTDAAIITTMKLSSNGDFLGVGTQASKKYFFEVHRLPSDGWTRELTSANRQLLKHESKIISSAEQHVPQQLINNQDKPVPPPVQIVSQEAEGTPNPSQTQLEGQSNPTLNITTGAVPSRINFSKPTLLIRVKCSNTPTPCNGTNPAQALSAYNNSDFLTLGKGLIHSLSAQLLDQRRTDYDSLGFISQQDSEAEIRSIPTFHFLGPTKYQPNSLEGNQNEVAKPSSVVMWWSSCNQIFHYPLPKSGRVDKPDLVWPNGDVIINSTLSNDKTLLAVALKNGILVIWDVYHGLERKIIGFSKRGSIICMQFLLPGALNETKTMPKADPGSATFRTGPEGLIVACSDGSLCIIECEPDKSETAPIILAHPSEIPFYRILPLPNLPQLFITVQKNSEVIVHDARKRKRMCEIVMSKSYHLDNPRKEGELILAKGGRVVVMRGVKDDTMFTELEDVFAVYAIQLHLCLELGEYFAKIQKDNQGRQQDENVKNQTTGKDKKRNSRASKQNKESASIDEIEERLNSMLRERNAEQALRQARMQQRWSRLKTELRVISAIKHQAKRRDFLRKAFRK